MAVSSLSVVCPDCGATLKACKLTPEPDGRLVGRCVSCNKVIDDLSTTLRYHCGKVLPDSSTIISGAMSKDLAKLGFLGGYTLLLHPVVANETDTPGGKRELERLGDYAAMDRIGWRRLNERLEDGAERQDEKVIEAAGRFRCHPRHEGQGDVRERSGSGALRLDLQGINIGQRPGRYKG